MRKEVVLGVADALEKAELAEKDVGFNMCFFYMTEAGFGMDKSGHHCGTTACIAGWVVALYDVNGQKRPTDSEPLDFFKGDLINGRARKTLGISRQCAQELFFVPSDATVTYHDVTNRMAARLLRNFAKTGHVDWKIFSDDAR